MSEELDTDYIIHEVNKIIEQDQAQLLNDVLDLYPTIVDRVDINERTWMHTAAESGSWGCLEVLKKHGLSIDSQDIMGQTPLQRALTRHRFDASKWFLENGADPNIKNIHGASSVLYAASWSSEMLEKVLSYGGDSNAKDKRGHGIDEWAQMGIRQAVNLAKAVRLMKNR